MNPQKTITENRLVSIVKDYEKRIGCTFKPNVETYTRLGINRKRLGLLVSGDAKKPLQVDELAKLADFFSVSINEILQIF